jgi:hypothetical protein
VVNAAGEQVVEDTTDGFVLTLPPSEAAEGPPARLRGVLVAGGRALAIDSEVLGPATAPGMPVAFIVGGVALAALMAFAACRLYCRP